VGGGVEGEQVRKGVDRDRGVPEAVEDGGRPAAEGGAGAGARTGKLVVSTPDARPDEGVVGVEGELGVQGGAEVGEGVPFLDGVDGVGGEEGADGPWEVGARRWAGVSKNATILDFGKERSRRWSSHQRCVCCMKARSWVGMSARRQKSSTKSTMAM